MLLLGYAMQQRVNRSLELVKLLITVTGNDNDGAGNPFSRDLLQSMETDKQGRLLAQGEFSCNNIYRQ